MPEKKEVVLIDLSAVFRTAWHANENGETSVAVTESKRMIEKAIGERRGRLIAIAADGRGSFRKELSPTYKANREKQPETMYGALDTLKEDLLRSGELIWQVDEFEADDVIASATDAAVAEGHDVLIVSHDKDLLQLLKPSVRALRISTWEVVDHDWVRTKYGVPPELMGDYLAIVGDKSDNIPGIAGAGPVAACAILNHFGSLKAFLEKVAERGPLAITVPVLSKFRAVLNNFATSAEAQDGLRLSRKLVELRYNVPIAWDEIYAERGPSEPGEEIDAAGYEDAFEDSLKAARKPESATPAPVVEVVSTEPPQAASSPVPAARPANGAEIVPVEVRMMREKAAIEEKAMIFQQFDSGLQPTGMAALYWLARRAIESKSGKFRNADEAMLVMLRGKDFGITPAAALDIFHVIEGKPCPPAALLIASAQRDERVEYLIPTVMEEKRAVYTGKLKGIDRVIEVEYTYEMAELAKLPRQGAKGPNNWLKYPGDMCVKMAGVRWGRRVIPAALLGAHCFEEMGSDA